MAPIAQKNCSVCKRPAIEKYRPFCSVRCADIDLGGWLLEKYRVPMEEEADTKGPSQLDTDIE